jgi:hypothetical protein
MKESDLYPAVRDWLTHSGYEVHVEIFDCDIVAVKEGLLTVVELKTCLSQELYAQCVDRARWADFVIAAIASVPRSTSGFTYAGFGVMLVRNGAARLKHKPRPQPWHWHKARSYRLKKLTGRLPAQSHEVAGLTSGNALRAQRVQRPDFEHRITFRSSQTSSTYQRVRAAP